MNYRSIYKKYYGEIPKGFEIHHIDGNRMNNSIHNLKLVSIEEHYDIHYQQQDYGACFMILKRMNRSSENVSDMSKLTQKQRVENGTHNFLGGEVTRNVNAMRLADGTHNFLGDRNPIKQHSSRIQKERVDRGEHNFLGGNIQAKQLENGTHPSQVVRTCPHCGKTGKGGAMIAKHFDKCKFKE